MRLFTNKITKPLQSYLVVVGGWLLFHPSQVPTGALSPLLLTHTQGLDIISIKSPDGVSTQHLKGNSAISPRKYEPLRYRDKQYPKGKQNQLDLQ